MKANEVPEKIYLVPFGRPIVEPIPKEGGSDVEPIVDWLKNKLKSLRPQKQWKPSDEQIIALRWVLNNIPYNKHKEEISGLLDQIKEL